METACGTHSGGLLLELGLSPRIDGLSTEAGGLQEPGLNPHPALLMLRYYLPL